MNDPYLRALYYSLVPGYNVDYEKAAPLTDETDDFRMSVKGDTATFEMKTDYATAEEAKAVVESYLQRWEVLIGLEHGPDNLSFTFKNADHKCPVNNRIISIEYHSSHWKYCSLWA